MRRGQGELVHPYEASIASTPFCHPDEASIASGWKDLGQRGASTAGSGFALLLSTEDHKERCAISKTGTGFAGAKLSEILPAARVARFVRMTERPCRFAATRR
jgi:hypothetical protein